MGHTYSEELETLELERMTIRSGTGCEENVIAVMSNLVLEETGRMIIASVIQRPSQAREGTRWLSKDDCLVQDYKEPALADERAGWRIGVQATMVELKEG